MPPTPPSDLDLAERQRAAVELYARQSQILTTLENVQQYASLREHLGLASQELGRLARLHWPGEAWESTRGSGPPRHGDWHVKVASTPEEGEVCLRIRTLCIDPEMQLRDVSALIVPLALAEHLISALQAHADYWRENPPSGGER